MPWEAHETFENAAKLLQGLAEASKPDSAGGTKIKLSEVVSILAEVGVSIVADIGDDDFPPKNDPE